MPDISNDGTVVFSLYEKGKYQIAILDKINFTILKLDIVI